MNQQERQEFAEEVAVAIAKAMSKNPQTEYPPEHAQWVELAIKRQAQSIKLRDAIIEKSISGLIWMAILGLLLIIREWLNNHGVRV